MSRIAFPRANSLSDLPNISIALGEELRRVGVRQGSDLQAVGAEAAWSRVRSLGRHDDIQTLLALEGAIQGVAWRGIPHDRRAELVRFATHATPRECAA